MALVLQIQDLPYKLLVIIQSGRIAGLRQNLRDNRLQMRRNLAVRQTLSPIKTEVLRTVLKPALEGDTDADAVVELKSRENLL